MLTSLSASTPVRKRTSPIQEPVQNHPPSKKVQVGPSLDLSTEDEMIDLGAEDTENPENIDPNVQAEKKSASLSRPLSSASNWASKNPSAKNSNSADWFCPVCTMPNTRDRTQCYACNKKKLEAPSAALKQNTPKETAKSGTYCLAIHTAWIWI